jgi:hypothetical protein
MRERQPPRAEIHKKGDRQKSSVADQECLSRIPDPDFSIPDPGSRVKKIPDPGSKSTRKNLSIFNPKNFS